MSVQEPGSQSSLACGYDPGEDRLVLAVTANGATRSIQLTRRLTSKLIDALAHMLEKSNAVADRVPAEMRDDVILLEHIQALGAKSAARKQNAGAGQASDGTAAGAPARNRVAHLAVKMTIAPKPPGFHLVVFGRSGALLQAGMSRGDLHRFLELFKRRAEAAGWNLVMESSWLQSDQGDVVIN